MVIAVILIISSLLISCSGSGPEQSHETKADNQTLIDYDLLADLPKKNISYQNKIKPILGKRCVVCHGCYDAPCQLKLSSKQGIQRGASKESIYDGSRIRHDQLSRLFIDAPSKEKWRLKGFFPIIQDEPNKKDKQAVQKNQVTSEQEKIEDNLNNSIMYQMLKLKQLYPQPRMGKLHASTTLNLDREQKCATPGEFIQFSQQHTDWGMPYAMPNLEYSDYKQLVQWIAQGSPFDDNDGLARDIQIQVKQWEEFFNQENKKQKLVSRYIYEHLFLAHLFFSEQESVLNKDDGKNNIKTPFFRMVRSTTPTGKAIKEIATRRPYDDPRTKKFYYRLKLDPSQMVIKDHKTYALSAQKMQRIKSLFIKDSYQVKELPSYEPKLASNPIKTYKDLPPVSRYKFLLDDAHFFIEGFIKGPVCRGQIALNVIDDYFWVTFINPDMDFSTLDQKFLTQNINYFNLPAQQLDTLKIFSIWSIYWKEQKKYIKAKTQQFEKVKPVSLPESMKYLWDGKGNGKGDGNIASNLKLNPSASLTVFRHFDSASVSYGLLGEGPETTWVIDYPIFERIHYLLVAGFDVYGNIGHQLNTRLYMDFLRMESEDNFLAFLPSLSRKEIRDSWYKGIRQKVDKSFDIPLDWLKVKSVIGYQTEQPKQELYEQLKQHFKPLEELAKKNNEGNLDVTIKVLQNDKKIQSFIKQINQLKGDKLELIPDVTFLRINMGEKDQFLVYTIINNKAYKHLSSLLEDGKNNERRDYQYDSLMVVNGLEGSYPNFFIDLEYADLDNFIRDFSVIKTKKDYEALISIYGIRRTNENFWKISDWFYEYYKKAHPIKSGYFDLNRYGNE